MNNAAAKFGCDVQVRPAVTRRVAACASRAHACRRARGRTKKIRIDLDAVRGAAILASHMGSNASNTILRTRRGGAAAVAVSAPSPEALRTLFAFGGIGILVILVLVVILRAGCAGQLG